MKKHSLLALALASAMLFSACDKKEPVDDTSDNSSRTENSQSDSSIGFGNSDSPTIPDSNNGGVVIDIGGTSLDEIVFKENDFSFTIDKARGGAVVKDYLGDSSEVKIPDTLGNRPVVYVDMWNCQKIISRLELPDTVTDFNLSIPIRRSLKYINIPKGMTSIGRGAFERCNQLEEIIIPDSVTKIGDSAFGSCNELREVVIGSGVTKIPDGMFLRCSRLNSVTIPDTVTEIGKSAFENCSIKELKWGKSVAKIGENAFGNNSFTEITIPDSVTEIGEYAFSGCRMLKSVTIPDSVTQINDCTFSGCVKLTDVNLGGGLKTIGVCAFSECISLESITLPDSVVELHSSAFADCIKLRSVKTGSGPEKIGGYVFRGCISLTDITLPDSLTEIGGWAFCDTKIKSITIPAAVTFIGTNPFAECDDLTEIKVDGKNPNYFSADGILYEKRAVDGQQSCITTLICCPKQKRGSVNVPEGVVGISDNAFVNCAGITEVTLPDTVTAIATSAFSCCASLSSMVIPDGVTSIGYWAFNGCTSLTSVKIPDSVTEIGVNAFADCEKIQATYKGKTYDYEHIDDLYKAING